MQLSGKQIKPKKMDKHQIVLRQFCFTQIRTTTRKPVIQRSLSLQCVAHWPPVQLSLHEPKTNQKCSQCEALG